MTGVLVPTHERVEPGAAPARRRPSRWVVGLALAALVAALAVTAATLHLDSGEDVLGLAASVGRATARLRWPWAAVVAALAAAHYLATAVAARAATGLPLPLAETFLVQLTAAAANRLTPAGLGGAGVNARYFTRRGLARPESLGAVGAAAVLGAVADLLVLAVLLLTGWAFGIGARLPQLTALTRHIRHLLGPVRSPWWWTLPALVVALVAVRQWRRSRAPRRADGAPGVWGPVLRLLRRPRSLATLLAASGATTFILGLAFVASIAMVPGTRLDASVATVLVAFMVAAAAGSAVPVPAGLGSTEGALVAVLAGLGESTAHAVQVVMVFRIVTFWAPAAVGVLAARTLYRRDAL